MSSDMSTEPTVDGQRRKSLPGILPIKSLKNYMCKFRLQGRIVEKSPLSTFQGRQGPGRVFTCVLVDSEGSAINAKFWNEAADKWFATLQKGKAYIFYRGRVGVSNKRFAGTVDHDYELQFDKDSEITEVEEAHDIPIARTIQYYSLRSLHMSVRHLPFLTNVLAVVHSYGPLRAMPNKSVPGEIRNRRVITVVDATQYAIDVTLWGDHGDVSETLLDAHPVVSFANLQVREWKGKNASTVMNTEVTWQVECDEALTLKEWYQSHSSEIDFENLSGTAYEVSGSTKQRPVITATLEEMTEQMEGIEDVDDVHIFRVHAYFSDFVYRRESQFTCLYNSCIKCSRKMADDSNFCANCGEDVQVNKRINLVCLLADETLSGTRVAMFHDQAQSILGISANKLSEWIEQSSEEKLHPEMKELFHHSLLWKRMTFTLRAKVDEVRDELRHNYVLVSAGEFSAIAAAARAMEECLKWLPNVFDVTFSKRLEREQEEQNPRRKLQCTEQEMWHGEETSSALKDTCNSQEQEHVEIPPAVDYKSVTRSTEYEAKNHVDNESYAENQPDSNIEPEQIFDKMSTDVAQG